MSGFNVGIMTKAVKFATNFMPPISIAIRTSKSVFSIILRYAHSYRSVFNGPRWGAILVMLVIAAAQVTAALHVSASESASGDYCCPAELSGHESAAAAAHACCSPRATASCADENDNASGSAVAAHEECDDCASDCEAGECGSDCCHHPPLNSPLPVPARQLSDASAPFVAAGILFPSPKEIPAPFQPPRA
jgi:hypothetical protein